LSFSLPVTLNNSVAPNMNMTEILELLDFWAIMGGGTPNYLITITEKEGEEKSNMHTNMAGTYYVKL